MRTLESWTPRRGLSIPSITVLDGGGNVIEDDQRRLCRYLVQSGRGADVIFTMGTNGEWNRLAGPQRHRVIQIAVEEVRKCASPLEQAGGRPVEAWVGVTAPTISDTLETLELALEIGAHAAVVAPLAIEGVDDPVRFLRRDVGDLFDRLDRRIPVFLYDNADIAAGRERGLRTRWVKAASRLDFVRGIKVSAPPRRLGHYTKAARQFRDLGAFAIYVGNALYGLEMMRPRTGLRGTILDHYNRFLLHDMLPAGVVSGPANLFPREWQHAWQVSQSGDVERMQSVLELFYRFRDACAFEGGRRTLAAVKRGLFRAGVISSDAVASGTKALGAADAGRLDADLERLREATEAALPSRWLSDPREADG